MNEVTKKKTYQNKKINNYRAYRCALSSLPDTIQLQEVLLMSTARGWANSWKELQADKTSNSWSKSWISWSSFHGEDFLLSACHARISPSDCFRRCWCRFLILQEKKMWKFLICYAINVFYCALWLVSCVLLFPFRLDSWWVASDCESHSRPSEFSPADSTTRQLLPFNLEFLYFLTYFVGLSLTLCVTYWNNFCSTFISKLCIQFTETL